jgi:hypothetical protein
MFDGSQYAEAYSELISTADMSAETKPGKANTTMSGVQNA